MTDNRKFYGNFLKMFFILAVQNIITLSVNLADNIMLGDIYMRAKELRVVADVPRGVFVVRSLKKSGSRTIDFLR